MDMLDSYRVAQPQTTRILWKKNFVRKNVLRVVTIKKDPIASIYRSNNFARVNFLVKCHILGTIAHLCRAISSQLRHVSTIRKKLVKQQHVLHMSPQYGELRPTSGWDRLTSLGVPLQISTGFAYWQRYCTASSSGRQPNFAALNRGRHLCLAGRPSR